MVKFADRGDAGRRLSQALLHLRDSNVIVLGLPRGGVPVAFEVARALQAPLDVIVVKKLGLPFQPELAMGAVGEGGVVVVDHRLVSDLGVTQEELLAVEKEQRAEIERRVRHFRGDRPRVPIAGRNVLIVDDGLATGATASAACQVARAQGAARVTLAAPVCSSESAKILSEVADEVVCLDKPSPFYAVGQYYKDFAQTSDREVVELLRKRAAELTHPDASADNSGKAPDAELGANSNSQEQQRSDPPDDHPKRHRTLFREVEIRVDNLKLFGTMAVPANARAGVVFALGSGSSHYNPRNGYTADVLNRYDLTTLLFDLLTPEEELVRAKAFDIELLAARLSSITRWLRDRFESPSIPIGYFGSTTGATAALLAASDAEAGVRAVVSQDGHPDLAGGHLGRVRAPTRLISGIRDEASLASSSIASAQLRCEQQLEILTGASHLGQELDALELAAELAAKWFVDHL
jgi:putative phosphoribosyl transferase